MQPSQTGQPAPPPACPLAALPEGVLVEILLRSGLHTRQLSRAFRAIHPPLCSLAPHGIDTPEELAAALAALPPSLTSLDLRYAHPGAITPATLAALQVPSLQRLTLPRVPHSVLITILDALHQLPHLHTLHAPRLGHQGLGYPDEPPQAVHWPTLLQAPIAARLRALALPMICFDTLHAAPSSTFTQLTAISLYDEADYSPHVNNDHLARLPGPAPALRRLSVDLHRKYPALPALAHLTALTTLTALQIKSDHNAWYFVINDLTRAIGTLTGLRDLQLHFTEGRDEGDDSLALDGAWLRSLTLLTGLDVMLSFCGAFIFDAPPPLLDEPQPAPPVQARVISALVQAAVALPQLQDLRLGFYDHHESTGCRPDWLACGTARSCYRQLATAAQLRRLRLCDLPLRPAEACLLSRLQGLTSLCIKSCETTEAEEAAQPEQDSVAAAAGLAAGATHWVAALTGLRELVLDNALVPSVVQAAAALPHLHTLVLDFGFWSTDVAAGHLQELSDRLQGVLVRLELKDLAWDTVQDAAVMRAFGSMTRLQVLSLRALGTPTPLMVSSSYNNLVMPRSLTRCYLPATPASRPVDGVAALCQLRARYPWVSFKPPRWPSDGEW